jgi:hypothetical protein
MNKPGIQTAIPRRRYRLGEFTVTVLGEVSSSDGIDYRYIAAVIQGQNPEPGMYLTAERAAGDGYAMRLVMRDGAEVIGNSEQWGELDAFVDEVLDVVARVLSLTDETPYRLM